MIRVRNMEEKHSKIQSIMEYKDKLKMLRNQRVLAAMIAVILIFGTALGISGYVRYRTYNSYETVRSILGEDTLSSDYVKLGENVLRYGINGARLTDKNGNELWNTAYAMENPTAQVTLDTAAVYEQNGTSLRTFNADGQQGEITTPYPIRKAKAAGQGVAAAILEDGENTWIKYYNTDGSEIASFRTRIDSPGYPMDLCLSPDGMTLAVTYTYMENGQMCSQVAFYNFGSAGKQKKDHLVQAFSYSGLMIPQIEYVDDDLCVAFTEKGFLTFQGSASPVETGKVEEEQEILSVSLSSAGVAMVVRSQNEENLYTLKMYTLSGSLRMQEEFSFSYEHLSMEENQILLWNRSEFLVCSFDGVAKFRGKPEEGEIRIIIGLGKQQYLGVLDQGLIYMKLK